MKKIFGNGKIKLIDVLLTTTIVFLTLTAAVLIFSDGKSDQQLKSVSSSAENNDSIIVDKTDSNYEGIKIVTETSNDPLSKYAIQYPQSENKEFNDKVSTYIKTAKHNYLEAMNQLEKETSKKKSELNISYETHVDQKGNYSFVLKNNEFLRGTSQVSEVKSFHLNPKTNKEVPVQTVFKDDPAVIQDITKRVREKIQNNGELKKGLIGHKMQVRTEPEWKNYEDYAITEDALVFYFEAGSLKDKKEGPQTVSLNIAKVNDLLAPDFQVASEDPKDEPEVSKEPDAAEGQSEDKPSGDSAASGGDSQDPADQPHEKKIALTFDDGPDPHSTVQILELLKKYDAKATFFMLGSRVEYYPDTAKAVKAAGHEIGNHSWNHPDLSKMPLASALEEINRTTAIIQKVTGDKPTVFRPPYGAYTEQLSKQTIPPIVLWNVDTLDWKYRDAGKLLEEVKKSAHEGSTILMHDIHQSTADGLESVLSYLQSEGYTFVTVSQLH